jgi:hypothetical protein
MGCASRIEQFSITQAVVGEAELGVRRAPGPRCSGSKRWRKQTLGKSKAGIEAANTTPKRADAVSLDRFESRVRHVRADTSAKHDASGRHFLRALFFLRGT